MAQLCRPAATGSAYLTVKYALEHNRAKAQTAGEAEAAEASLRPLLTDHHTTCVLAARGREQAGRARSPV